MEAEGYVIGADISNTGKYFGAIDRGVFQVQEPGFIAAVAKEALMVVAGRWGRCICQL